MRDLLQRNEFLKESREATLQEKVSVFHVSFHGYLESVYTIFGGAS
jgi:hypothetical protein